MMLERVYGGGIALFDRVEDCAIPDIDVVLEADIGDNQDHKDDGEYPCQPVTAFSPESLGADPEWSPVSATTSMTGESLTAGLIISQ
jgi:hypothetical protein